MGFLGRLGDWDIWRLHDIRQNVVIVTKAGIQSPNVGMKR